jgi:hypothetical protein
MAESETKSSWHGYVLAVMIGVVLIPLSLLLDPKGTTLTASMLWSAVLYFLFAAVAGGLTPRGSRWVGLCVAAPLVLLVGASYYLVAGAEEFVGRDIPVISASVVAAVAGGWVGSRLVTSPKDRPEPKRR